MACERFLNAIHELIDGTLGPIRRAELELHLESCDDCRALVGDLREIGRASESLADTPAPAHVWPQIAARLQQEGRVHSAAGASWYRNTTMLAIAAGLVLVVGASLFLLRPRDAAPPTPTQAAAPTAAPQTAAADPNPAGNADPAGIVQSLEQTDASLQKAVEQLTQLNDTLDPQTKADIQKNVLVVTQAVADTRARLTANPQDAAAQQSFYETLRQKIQFLQNTITLMNEMRQGDAAGAAQIVEGGKS
jgi:anti-sigma factor RsiW